MDNIDTGHNEYVYSQAGEEIDRLRKENAELKALLREVEWVPTPMSYDYDGTPANKCRVCYGFAQHGHRYDCRLAAALKGRSI